MVGWLGRQHLKNDDESEAKEETEQEEKAKEITRSNNEGNQQAKLLG